MGDEARAGTAAADPGEAPRTGPPRWVLIGFGCMGVVGFLLALLAFWTMSWMGRLGNKSEAWKSLGELIAFEDAARGTPTGVPDDPATAVDESHTPREFELLLGGESFGSGGIEAYWFGRDVSSVKGESIITGDSPLFVALVKLKSDQTEAAMTERAGAPRHEERTFDLQGASFRGHVLPFMVIDRPTQGLTRSEEVKGAGVVLVLREGFTDPEHDDESFDLLAFFQRPGSSEPVALADIEAFFEPFDLAGIASFGQGEGEAAEPADEPR